MQAENFINFSRENGFHRNNFIRVSYPMGLIKFIIIRNFFFAKVNNALVV